ncbi:MAG: protein kinase, partial [Planctomycetota bacterium]
FKHGDIRNDHLIIERDTGNYVWIDFDYDFDTEENPFSLDIFGLGNILLYAVGKGFHNLYMINNDSFTYGDLIDRLEPGDFCVLDKRRLINLRKLYPFIPMMLNDILMHFSNGADVYYETVDEIIEDLNRCLYSFLDKEEGHLE